MQAIVSGMLSSFVYAMLVSAVWKLFQMSADLGEIKKILSDIRGAGNFPAQSPAPGVSAVNTTPAVTPPPALPVAGPISLESAEALLREVAAESQALAAAERPR
jgi:hypothetical protein